MTTILLIPDVHVPIHHRAAVAAVMEFIRDLKPDEVHQQGDVVDMESVARWTTGTLDEDGRKLQKELDALDLFWADLREAQGKRRVTYIDDANHCGRLQKYAETKARGLFGLDALQRESLFHLDKHDVEMVKAPYLIAPGVVSIHGVRLGTRAGFSVHKEIERYGSSVVMGHCHRQAVVYRTSGRSGARTTLFGVEGGSLIDQRKATYLDSGHPADWQMGITVLYVDGKDVHPVPVPIKSDGSFLFMGKRYRG